MPTPDMTMISRAEFDTAKTAATGRKLLTIDGDTIEMGDTGLRDVSGLLSMTHLDAGRLLMCRVGKRVWIHGDFTFKATAPSSVTVFVNDRVNTGGFRPPYAATARAIASSGNGTGTTAASADVFINPNLGITFHGVVAGHRYVFSVSFDTTSGWPTTLPGVADGQPIGV